MKKILILYAKYGGGHFSAANAIYNYLKTNKNLEIEMIDCIEYINKFLNTSTTGAYKFLAKKAPQAWKKIYYGAQKGVLSKVSNSTNILMAKKLNKLFKEYQPDIVISTTSSPAPSITESTEYTFFLGAVTIIPLILSFFPRFVSYLNYLVLRKPLEIMFEIFH